MNMSHREGRFQIPILAGGQNLCQTHLVQVRHNRHVLGRYIRYSHAESEIRSRTLLR